MFDPMFDAMTPSVSLLAAGAAPPFFAEVAALLVASAVMAYFCYRLGVTPIVSFLVTGALIGPGVLGLVQDRALIEAAAEVGVVLLLFTIGIEFSLEKLARIQRLIFVGGGLQVGLVVAVVTGILYAWGIGWRTGVFTGCLVALSSTAIVMKLLMSRGESDTEGGQAVLGILIFQDLAIVAMVLLVPMLAVGGAGGAEGGGGGLAIAWALGKAVGIILLVLVVARRVMPRVMEAVAKTCSQEIFVLTVMAICFGTAFLTSLAGVSLSLGAFLAGLVVSESRFSELAFGEIQPLQILFSATFFVSVGLLLDLGFLASNLPLVLAIVGAVLVLKILATAASVKLLGYDLGTTLFSSLMIAQVGEFSFVLERTGREVGLFPAGFENGGPQAFIAATVLSMMITPLLAKAGAGLEGWRRRGVEGRHAEAMAMSEAEHDEAREAGTHAHFEDHVIIAGYGRAGKVLARALRDEGVPFLILTLSPEGAREAEGDDLPVLRGNYQRGHELSLAGVRRARLLVVADDDFQTTHKVVHAVHAMAPDLPILAATGLEGEVEGLLEAGAAEVVAAERESALRLVEEVLGRFGIGSEVEKGRGEVEREGRRLRREAVGGGPAVGEPEADPDSDLAPVRLTDAQAANPDCGHTDLARTVTPSSHGCEECLRLGDTWQHLRVCMTCGQVACCDSSKNQHASKHAAAAGHPIVKSREPGEDWAWCYEDERML